MKISTLTLSLSLIALAAGCDSAASGGYLGDPQFTVQGVVTSQNSQATAQRPTLGLLWYKFTSNGDSSAGETAPIAATAFPAQFDFDLLDIPADAVLNQISVQSQTEAEFALGYIIVFDDINGDGKFDPTKNGENVAAPDVLLGGASNHVVLYVKTAPSATSQFAQSGMFFENFGDLTPGFHLAKGVCGSGSQTYDRLMIVPNSTAVDVTLSDESIEDQPSFCLNVF